jgi:hypothetical protein
MSGGCEEALWSHRRCGLGQVNRTNFALRTALAFLLACVAVAHSQRPSKPEASSQARLLGLTLEKSTFTDVQNKLGAAKIGQCSHEVEPISYIGYVSLTSDKTKVLFESNRFDPPFELSGFRVVAGSRSTAPCQIQYKPTAAFDDDVETAGGLKLGLTKAELLALLGSPSKVSGNRITFEWWSKRPMNKAEIDRETKTFKAPVTRPYWDVHDVINVILSGAKVVDFEVRRTVTY